MTATALAATVTGTLLTLTPIDPQAVRNAHRTIDPEFDQDPQVAADLATIDRITAWMPDWQLAGLNALYRQQAARDDAEDRLLAAYGYPVPTDDQRYAARQAKSRAERAVQDAAGTAHPVSGCPRCRAWEDCADADRALRDAVHADWVNRWGAPAPTEPEPLYTVEPRGALIGYVVFPVSPGAPLPQGRTVAAVTDAHSDTTWYVTDTDGREHSLHKYGELRRYSTGVVAFVEPAWSGWASD